MVSQIIKQIVVAVAFVGAVGPLAAATATSTVYGVVGVNSYTFSDLSTSTAIAIADLTFSAQKIGLNFTFDEGGNKDVLLTNATSLTIYYYNNGGGAPSSWTYALSSGLNDTVFENKLGGNGAAFNYATLNYTYTPITAVPEPESYAMLLAGLGLMGTIALRRNKNKAG